VCRLHGSAPEASTNRTISGPVLLPPQQPPLPVAGTQTTEILRSTVRTTAIRLVSLDGSSSPGPASARSSWAEPHQQQSPLKVGYSWKSLFGLQQSGQLKVVLQASDKHTSMSAAMRPAAHCFVTTQPGMSDCQFFLKVSRFWLPSLMQKPRLVPTLQVMSHLWSLLAQVAEGKKAATLSLAQMRQGADWRSLSSLAVA